METVFTLCGSSLSQRSGLKRVGEERKGEEDVRTSSNCLQFRPLGHGGRQIEKLLFCISSDKKLPSGHLNWNHKGAMCYESQVSIMQCHIVD